MSEAPSQEHTARRRTALGTAARLSLMLAFGAAASVLIALGCSLLHDGNTEWSSDELGRPVVRTWLWTPPPNWPKKPDECSWERSVGYKVDHVSWNGGEEAQWMTVPAMDFVQTRYAAGFPFAALRARCQGGTGPVARAKWGRFAFYDWGVGTYSPSPAISVFPVIVPLIPSWPGLLIDTALYGAAGGLLVRWLVRIRRRARARRGLCVSCGYAVGGLPSCPECGTTTALVP